MYYRPTTIEGALQLWAPSRRFVAGGTDVFARLHARREEFDVIDLSAVDGLSRIERSGSTVRIGACATWTKLRRQSDLGDGGILAKAAAQLASIPIQNRATIGGNICNASPAADGTAALLALGARVELLGANSRRILLLSDFLHEAGGTDLRDGEVLSAVEYDMPTAVRHAGFMKIGRRRSCAISVVVAAMVFDKGVGGISQARVIIGAASIKPRLLARTSSSLMRNGAGLPLDEQLLAMDVQELAPISDLRGSAAYRRHAAGVLVRRLWGELGGEGGA